MKKAPVQSKARLENRFLQDYAQKAFASNVQRKVNFQAPRMEMRTEMPLFASAAAPSVRKACSKAAPRSAPKCKVSSTIRRSESLVKAKSKPAEKTKKNLTIEDHPLWNAFEVKRLPTKFSGDAKSHFVQVIASSLMGGGLVKNPELLKRSGLMDLFNLCATYDPEYVFKVMLYCRKELKIRSTTNFLYAKAAEYPNLRPYLMKYSSVVIALPSDWLEVVHIYQKNTSQDPNRLKLPAAMRKALTEKFKEFDEYQLAKYNNENLVKTKERRRIKNEAAKKGTRKSSYPSSTTTEELGFSLFMSEDDKMSIDDEEEERNCVIDNDLFENMELDEQVLELEVSDDRGTRMKRVTFQILTMKKILRNLHISQPHEFVMSLLGKRYPADVREFAKSGMPGQWQPQLAGQRMSLKVPFTWETEVSQKGNKREVWEELIASKKLPYMALLRNLRNICLAGCSRVHISSVCQFLSKQHNVMNSKQFPLQFYTALQILRDLHKSRKEFIEKFNETKRKAKGAEVTKLVNTRTRRLLACQESTIITVQRAVEAAFCISLEYNLPAVRNRTLIITMRAPMQLDKKNDAGLMRALLSTMCIYACEESDAIMVHGSDFSNISKNMRSLQADGRSIIDCIEHIMTLENTEGKLSDHLDEILADRVAYDAVVVLGMPSLEIEQFVENYRKLVGPIYALANPEKIERVLKYWMVVNGHSDQIVRFLAERGDEKLMNRIEHIDSIYGLNSRPVHITSATEPVGERGLETANLRPCVNQLKKNVAITTEGVFGRWRSSRIFISSTFRDMHAERDLICGVVMPAVRRRINKANARHPIQVNEIDLRWGAPESEIETSSSLRLCLEFASEADVFVLLVGARYGWVPSVDMVESLPAALLDRVKRFYEPGMSVTEMEFNMALQSAYMRIEGREPSAFELSRRILVYIRDYDSISTVPRELKSNFIEATAPPKLRLQALMKRLRGLGIVQFDRYPATYSQLIGSRACMGNLTELGDAMTHAILEAVQHTSPAPIAKANLAPHKKVEFARSTSMETLDTAGHSHVTDDTMGNEKIWTAAQVTGSQVCLRQYRDLLRILTSDVPTRGAQVSSARYTAALQELGRDRAARSAISSKYVEKQTRHGCIVLVSGAAGIGKSTLMAALATRLKLPAWQPAALTSISQNGPTSRFAMRGNLLNRGAESDEAVLQKSHLVFVHFTSGLLSDYSNIIVSPKQQLTAMLDQLIAHLVRCVECMRPGYGAPLVQNMDKIIDEYEDQLFNATGTLSSENKLTIQIPMVEKLINYVGRHDRKRYYTFVIDSIDNLYPQNRINWIPEILPANVTFFVSSGVQKSFCKLLATRSDVLVYAMNQLTSSERSALIRSLFSQYGKILNESSFRNQLAVIVNKREAGIPLYLKLACDELRQQGQHDELDQQLKQMPQTIPKLFRFCMENVASKYGIDLVKAALSFALQAKRPLHSSELLKLLEVWLNEDSCAEGGSQQRITSLAFHGLLAGLQVVFCGLGEDSVSDDAKIHETNKSNALSSSYSGLLCIRTPELRKLATAYIAGELNDSQDSKRFGGFSSSFSSNAAKAGRSKDKKVDFDKVLWQQRIYRILARELDDLENEVYYMFMAGDFLDASERLCSLHYLTSRLDAIASHRHEEYSLISDFRGYADEYEASGLAQVGPKCRSWMTHPHLVTLRDIVLRNLHTLVKYPGLLAELCINQLPSRLEISALGERKRAGSTVDSVTDLSMFDLTCEVQNMLMEIKKLSLDYNEAIDVAVFEGTQPFSADEGLGGSDSDAEEKCPGPRDNPLKVNPLLLTKKRRFIRSRPLVPPTQLVRPSALVSLEGNVDPNVCSVILSPYNRLMAYGTGKGCIIIADVVTGKSLDSLYGHTDCVNDLCFIPLTGTPSTSLEHEAIENSLSWDSPQYLLLCSAGADGHAIIWQLGSSDSTHSGRRVVQLRGKHAGEMTTCAYDMRSRTLALGNMDGTVSLWHLPIDIKDVRGMKEPTRVLTRLKSKVTCLAFRFGSPHYVDEHTASEANALAIGCWNGSLQAYNMRDRRVTVPCVQRRAICSLAYSTDPHRRLLAVMCITGEILLLNASNFSIMSRLDGQRPRNAGQSNIALRTRGVLGFIALPPKNPLGYKGVQLEANNCEQVLYHSGGALGQTGHITMWNAHLGEIHSFVAADCGVGRNVTVTAQCTDHLGKLRICGLSNGSYTVMLGCSSMPVPRLDKSSLNALSEEAGPPVLLDVALMKGVVVAVTQAGHLDVLKLDCKLSSSVPLSVNDSAASRLDWVEQMKSAAFESIKLKRLKTFERNGGPRSVLLQIFMTDRDELILVEAFANHNLTVTALNVSSGSTAQLSSIATQFDHSAEITAVAFEDDLLASVGKDAGFNVYKVTRAKSLVRVHNVPRAHQDWITAVAWYAPDEEEKMLLTGGNESIINVWRISTEGGIPYKIFTISEHIGSIIALSVFRTYVCSAANDGTIRVWTMKERKQSNAVTRGDYYLEQLVPGRRCSGRRPMQRTRKCVTRKVRLSMTEEPDPMAFSLVAKIEFANVLSDLGFPYDVMTATQMTFHRSMNELLTIMDNTGAWDTSDDGESDSDGADDLCRRKIVMNRSRTKQRSTVSDIALTVNLALQSLDHGVKHCSLSIAPFCPKLRAKLEGHPGVPALSIGTSLSPDCVVNLIAASGKGMRDLRKFELTADLAIDDERAITPSHHTGQVTALAVGVLNDAYSSEEGQFLAWCVTGSADGSLIFWRLFESLLGAEAGDGDDDLNQNTTIGGPEVNAVWRPYCQLLVKRPQATINPHTVINSLAIHSSAPDMHVVFIGFGNFVLKLQLNLCISAPWPLDNRCMLTHAVANLSMRSDTKLQTLILNRVVTAFAFDSNQEGAEKDRAVYASLIDGSMFHCVFSPDTAFSEYAELSNADQYDGVPIGDLMALGGGGMFLSKRTDSDLFTLFPDTFLNYPALAHALPCMLPKEGGEDDFSVGRYHGMPMYILIEKWKQDEEDNYMHTIRLHLGPDNDSIDCKIYSRITAVHYAGLSDRLRENHESGKVELIKCFVLFIATEPDHCIHVLECCAPQPSAANFRNAHRNNAKKSKPAKVIGRDVTDRNRGRMARKQPRVEFAQPSMNQAKNFLWNLAEWEQVGSYPVDNLVTKMTAFCRDRYSATHVIDLIVGTKTGDVQCFKIL